MKKKPQISENYLEKKPAKTAGLGWSVDEDGAVTLELENTGVMNRIAQKLIGKPKISYIKINKMVNIKHPIYPKYA